MYLNQFKIIINKSQLFTENNNKILYRGKEESEKEMEENGTEVAWHHFLNTVHKVTKSR
jgi:hypothetical protein